MDHETKIEKLIEAAARHGMGSELDHEVGDLQGLLRAAVEAMSEDQTAMNTFFASDEVTELLEEWGEEDMPKGPFTLIEAPFNLRDEEGRTLSACITVKDSHAEIALADHSNGAFKDSVTAPIAVLELWEGKPRLVVHGDYHSEEPTHTVDLSGAKRPEPKKVKRSRKPKQKTFLVRGEVTYPFAVTVKAVDIEDAMFKAGAAGTDEGPEFNKLEIQTADKYAEIVVADAEEVKDR